MSRQKVVEQLYQENQLLKQNNRDLKQRVKNLESMFSVSLDAIHKVEKMSIIEFIKIRYLRK